MGEKFLLQPKTFLSPPPPCPHLENPPNPVDSLQHQILIPGQNKSHLSSPLNTKNNIFSCSHCSCSIFVLISYSFDLQVMLIFFTIHGF